MSSDFNKNKKSNQKRFKTTNPKNATSNITSPAIDDKKAETIIPLQAKDSEWVDILNLNHSSSSTNANQHSVEKEMLKNVESQDVQEIKPLAILFPGLLNKDPQTLHGMLNKTMSTTEVTRHLVNLGEKANFTVMKKTDRLIPQDKKRLECLTEKSNSYCSTNSELISERKPSSTAGAPE